MQDDDETDLPPELVDAIRRADEQPRLITARVDRELARQAEHQFAGRSPRRSSPSSARRRWRMAAVGAVAAAVLVAVTFVINPGDVNPGEAEQPIVALGDLDGSGQIDIADVMAMARAGQADRATVERFARQVVRIQAARS